MKESWPVDAFDASHFDVCGGAWAGDISGESRGRGHRQVFFAGVERWRLLAAFEVLGQDLYHLAGVEDA